jgi:hypothetical protein
MAVTDPPFFMVKEGEILIKQPWEQYFLGFNLAKRIGNRTIDEVEIIAMLDGEDVTDDVIDEDKTYFADHRVYFWHNQSDEGIYHITCRAILTDGSYYEEDGRLKVMEIEV